MLLERPDITFLDGTTEKISFNTTGPVTFYLTHNYSDVETDIQFQYHKSGYQYREYFINNYDLDPSDTGMLNLTFYDIDTGNSSGIIITITDPAFRELHPVPLQIKMVLLLYVLFITILILHYLLLLFFLIGALTYL